ncbi:hypothetical protein CHARACLAT_030926 [Characodon lateralis]|uniref:Uncharacterized protein n=1 Tax=Characodon lateralis TaxID=208331 RepID=A0ABU7EZL8_9TELE|nr:hypothetical protein [Characodon lateralis]
MHGENMQTPFRKGPSWELNGGPSCCKVTVLPTAPPCSPLFSKKGGVPGTKIRLMLNSLSQQHVESRRETIIRCMMEFLGESAEELIKDYMNVSREEAKGDQVEQEMKICVFHVSEGHEGLSHADVSIVVEGTEVLHSCPSVAKASFLLMGIIYALNLPTKTEVHV